MFLPDKFKIDLPDKFTIDFPEKLTIVHLLDFDEHKLNKLTTSVGMIVSMVMIVGGFTRYCLSAVHRQPAAALKQPAAPEVSAAAPEVSAAPENLLGMAVLNISYMRKLFPENYFNDKSVPALVMKIKKLMPMDAESRRMIDWMEKGVNDALQKKYLKTLLFCVCETVGGPMIEEYAFSFSYSNSESQEVEVSMNVNRIGNKRQGGRFSSTEITPNQMRSSACKICALIMLIGTLDEMPKERTILMKLLYYDDVPVDYEPPCFRRCTEEEVNNPWTKNPLKMKVHNVNSKHLVFALEVKSVLDPCKDENDDKQDDDDVSLGSDSDASDSETEPAALRGFAQVMEIGRTNGNGSFKGESSSQSKRPRKASVPAALRGFAQVMEIGRTNGNGSFKGESSSQSKRPRKASVPAALRGFAQVMEIGRTNGNGSFKGESSSQSKRPRKASVPAALRGFAQVMEIGRTNGNGSFKGESSSQSKRPRKASIVEEPILQKAQVA